MLSCLVNLERTQQRHNLVDLYKLSLLESEVGVCFELLLHALTEFLPVEVPDQVFEKILVQLVGLRKCVGVHLNQNLVL